MSKDSLASDYDFIQLEDTEHVLYSHIIRIRHASNRKHVST